MCVAGMAPLTVVIFGPVCSALDVAAMHIIAAVSAASVACVQGIMEEPVGGPGLVLGNVCVEARLVVEVESLRT